MSKILIFHSLIVFTLIFCGCNVTGKIVPNNTLISSTKSLAVENPVILPILTKTQPEIIPTNYSGTEKQCVRIQDQEGIGKPFGNKIANAVAAAPLVLGGKLAGTRDSQCFTKSARWP